MERREFLAAGIAAAISTASGQPQAPTSPGVLRIIERQQGDRWDRVRMAELRTGDVFRFADSDHPEMKFRAVSDGEARPAPEYGSIVAEYIQTEPAGK